MRYIFLPTLATLSWLFSVAQASCPYSPCVPIKTTASSEVQALPAWERGVVEDGDESCCCLATSFVTCGQAGDGDGVVVDFGRLNLPAAREYAAFRATGPGVVAAPRSQDMLLGSTKVDLGPSNPQHTVQGKGYSAYLAYLKVTTMRASVHKMVHSRVVPSIFMESAAQIPPPSVDGALSAPPVADALGAFKCEINSLASHVGDAIPAFPTEQCKSVCTILYPSPKECSRFSLCYQHTPEGLPETWVGVRAGGSIFDMRLLSAFETRPVLNVNFAGCDDTGEDTLQVEFRMQIDPDRNVFQAIIAKGTWNGSPIIAGPQFEWKANSPDPGWIVSDRL